MPQLKVKAFGGDMFMDTADGAIQHYSGVIDQPGHPLDGKRISKSVHIFKKKPGYIVWHVEDDEQTFDHLDQLMAHHQLKDNDGNIPVPKQRPAPDK